MTAQVLIVEDEDRLREMMAYALVEEGYTVTQAPNGEVAINLLLQNRPAELSYAVVITDLVMGSIDGIEVMNVARNLSDPPEVIVLTGHGSLETAIAAVDGKAFAYLLKPCAPDQLRERVAAALSFRAEQLRQHEKVSAWNTINEVFSQVQGQGSSENKNVSRPIPGPAERSEQETHDDDQHTATRCLAVGDLRIDTFRHEVTFNGSVVHVTPTEYKILLCLAYVPCRVVPFSDIIAQTHGPDVHMTRQEARDLLFWHVRNLRAKVDRRYIASVRGVGYMLCPPK